MTRSNLLDKYSKLIEKISQFKSKLDEEIDSLEYNINKDEIYDQNVSLNFNNSREDYDLLLSYQIWIGELGKIIIDLTNDTEYYKKEYFFHLGKINELSQTIGQQSSSIRDLNEAVSRSSVLKKELNQLYNQFYIVKEEDEGLKTSFFLRLRNKAKNILRISFLSKLYVLSKAVLSLRFAVYVKEYRIQKKYIWEVNFLRNSGSFDYHYYLSKYPDIQPMKVDPIWHYVVHGWKEGRNPNEIFDSSWYLHIYDDIRNAGINPFLHYLQKGISEERRPTPGFNVGALNLYLHGDNYIEAFVNYHNNLNATQGYEKEASEVQILSLGNTDQYQLKQIVYVSGLFNNTSHQFRVVDQINILRELNYNVTTIQLETLEENEHLLVFAEVVVLFRVAWDDKLERIISKCRKAGVFVVYDTDDFVFDPRVANEEYVDGIRFLPEKEKKLYYEGVLRYQTAIENCDAGIFTTSRLAEAYKHLHNKESFIIKNGFSDYFFETSVNALREISKSNNTVILGYASGSLTHQKDFRIASKPIAGILKKHQNAKLRIVGLLDINEFPELINVKEQIEIFPVATHATLPYELAKFDINLAPLEIGNPFCEAKSDLKYFEAALVKVPTIASATEPYRKAIINSKTGYLASNEEDWYKYLDLLVSNRSHRHTIADNAYNDSLDRYSYTGKKEEVRRTFDRIYELRKEIWNQKDLSHTISFVLPEMAKGSGGHAKAISIAKWLTQFGYSITLNFIGNHTDYPDSIVIEKEFELNTSLIRVIYTDYPSNDSNIIIATFWKTIYYIENSNKLFKKKFHLLQDYEPYFYSMGTDYLLAINAMKKNFRKISYGPWVKNIIYSKHSIEAESMPFYYNKDVYNDDKTIRKPNVILFFARPEMPRRCFDLGWKALKIYREKFGNDTEIIIFGSYAVEHINIGFQHTNLNVKKPADLAALYRSSTVGIAFSPTNPSMVPFEMMACGLPVLDLDVEGNEINYGGRDNVFLVSPDENEIAERINEIINNSVLREEVALRGKNFIQSLPSEVEAIKEFEKYLQDDK